MDVTTWLGRLGLEQYAAAFEENDIDLTVLADLTSEDLAELGVRSIGHRRRIMKALETLRADEPPPAPVPQPAPLQVAPAADAAGADSLRRAERRQLTVLFADLVGSTALSTQLDPEDMSAVIDSYQKAVAAVVERYEGFIAQYIGDGIAIYFGYPKAHENDAERAVRASLEIVSAVRALSGPGGVALACRIGVATGVVVAGDIFSAAGVRDSVVGDTPNLAARLQSLGAPGDIIIGPSMRPLLRGVFDLEALPAADLKGIDRPVQPHRVLGIAEDPERHARGQAEAPMLGREPELALLRSRWSAARDGEAQLALVSGQAGIGKSRLITSMLQVAFAEDAHVRRYFCSPFHAGSAYHPVAVALERSAQIERTDPIPLRLEKLDALLTRAEIDPAEAGPLLAPLLSIDPGDHYPPSRVSQTAVKRRTFDLLADLTLGRWEDKPLLVVIEDAHWLDPTTTELLGHFLARAEGRRVMFLVSFRPEFENAFRDAPIATSTIELSRLSRARCRDMIVALAGGKAVPAEVVDHIVDRSDGIPLFVEEMAKSILESVALDEQETGFVLRGPLASFEIPSTLKDSLMSRLDRLSPVKQIAQVGAVLGRRFTLPLLAAIAQIRTETLEQALDALVESELVYRSGVGDERIFTFKHALIRDAAYESLLNSRRAELHARAAQAIEVAFPELVRSEPHVVANHFELAGQPARAVDYWLAAGKKAMGASAMVEAMRYLEHGLTLIDRIATADDRSRLEFGLRMALGLAHISLEGWQAPSVVRHLAPAYEIGQRVADRQSMLMVIYGLWIHWLNRAEFAEAARWIECAEEARGDSTEDDWALVVHTMRLIQERWCGSHPGVVEQAEKVLALYDPARHGHFVYMFGNDPRVCTLGFRSWSRWMMGDTEGALADQAACAVHAAEIGHPFDHCWQLMVGSLVGYFTGDEAAFSASVAEARRIGVEQDLPAVNFILGPVWTGLTHVLRGEWQAAADVMPPSIGGWKAMGGGVAIPFWEGTLGYVHIRLGERQTGLAMLDGAIGLAEATGESWYVPELHRLRGLALKEVDVEAARAAFETAAAVAQAQGAMALVDRATAEIRRL